MMSSLCAGVTNGVLSVQVYVPSTFWITILDAFYQSLVCFFVPYFVSRRRPLRLMICSFAVSGLIDALCLRRLQDQTSRS